MSDQLILNAIDADIKAAEDFIARHENFFRQEYAQILDFLHSHFPGIPCYAAGTRIRTVRGEVAVEKLQVGDEVVTASGEARPIKWLGHREIPCAIHPNPASVWPVRIKAGAVAPGLPVRDLVVSPGHHLFFDDVLVPASHVVNGDTILRDEVATVTYWHVELETHDILLAEGMPAESYLDVGNRSGFENGGGVVDAHPEFGVQAEHAGFCVPQVLSGPRLLAIRRWLLARSEHLGRRMIGDPGIQFLADGEILTPVHVVGNEYRFTVPAAAARVELRSRATAPSEILAESDDVRRLGVLVRSLSVDGVPVQLDDERLARGWHAPEREGDSLFRWTDGQAELPVGREITLTISSLNGYLIPTFGTRTPGRSASAETARTLRLVA